MVEMTPERQDLHCAVRDADADRASLARLLGAGRAEWYLRRKAGGADTFTALARTMGWA